MTDRVDLDRVDALCEQATPGPWELDVRDDFYSVVGPGGIRAIHDISASSRQEMADATYFVAAANAYPALSAELRAARAEIARRDEFNGCDGCSTRDCPHDGMPECIAAQAGIIREQEARIAELEATVYREQEAAAHHDCTDWLHKPQPVMASEGDPSQWAEQFADRDQIGTITFEHERGDDSVGIPDWAGFTLRLDDDLTIVEKARIAELEAIVERLPKTADGVPVVPGMKVYPLHPIEDAEDDHGVIVVALRDAVTGDIHEHGHSEFRSVFCYSTREAALAAAGAKP